MMLFLLNLSSLKQKEVSLLVLAMFMLSPAFGQGRKCGTMEYLEQQVRSNPNITYRMRQIESQAKENVKSIYRHAEEQVEIPVVIHVIYKNDEQNISDAQIMSQLRVLNEDFQRLNPDRIKTPETFRNVAANPRISFRLASLDPNGNPTNGITRTRTNISAFYSSDNGVKYSAMGGVDAWPTSDYLNIWVCNLGLGILGYSQFPGGPAETDGVVIGYKYFGTIGQLRAPFNLGRTTTHEVGHWLNLRHIWGDGPCGVDDGVDDTPMADGPNQGCSFGHSSCGSVNMTQNFMDYTDDACMNLFTSGQAVRMRALFLPGGARRSLLNSRAFQQAPPAPAPVPVPVVNYEVPEGVEVTAVTATTARLSWSAVEGADYYLVRMRREGGKWMPRKFNRTFVNATGLRSCTQYEFQLESYKDGKASGYSDMTTFKTLGCKEADDINDDIIVANGNVPDHLETSQVTSSDAIASWAPVSGAIGYKFQYKMLGGDMVRTKKLRGTSVRMTNLQAGERYFYRVRAYFKDRPGKYSSVESFYAGDFAQARRATSPPPFMRTSPNIVESWVKIELDVTSTTQVAAAIKNMDGQIIRAYRSFIVDPGMPFEFDCRDLDNGSYIMAIRDKDGFIFEERIRVNHR